jgi:ligand-binding SRPBCC domain-containing protein
VNTGEQIMVASRLDAPAEDVWAVVSTMDGVNAELTPYLRMSVPKTFRGRSLSDAPVGRPAFTSTILAGGVLPFDRHHLRFDEIIPGEGFVEHSTSLLERAWRHERRVRSSGQHACTIVDQVIFVPRLPGVSSIVGLLVARLFAHRHAKLRERFGGSALP